MKRQSHDRYAPRESLLELLSDDETAKVSNAESAPLSEGDEYIDLTEIAKGVQRADGVQIDLGHTLPRKAVLEATWSSLMKRMTSSHDL